MKKLMVFAMAAMVALASCSKTELVDNSAPTPISFKAVTGSVTKGGAVTPNDVFNYTLGVLAYNNEDLTEYFENAEFTKQSETVANDDGGSSTVTYWDGGKYWPIISSLDFVVYSPYQSSGVDVINTEDSKKISVTVDNSITLSSTPIDQTDYMYSNIYIANKNKESGNVSVELNHALSWITVNLDYDENIIVNMKATLDNTYQKGTYTVQYLPEIQNNISWTPVTTDTYSLDLSNGANNYMVVPSDATSITIVYKMEGMTGDALEHTIDLEETWTAGYHYTYNVTIGHHAINFTPSVNPWPNGTGSDTVIN